MKKFLKGFCTIFLIGAMIFAFTGCNALDDMRAHQIFPNEDGSFVINGIRYVPLDANEYFAPGETVMEDYYLTEPDVPVLLSQQYALGRMDLTEDGRFCRDWYRGIWFCAEDIYEEMQARNLEPFVPEILFYNFYNMNKNGEWVEIIYTLSEEETTAIAEVMKGEPLQLGNGIYISYDWEYSLIEASEDLLFRHSGPCIGKAGDTYYLSTYKETGATTYQVPEEFNALFDNFSAAYLSEFDYGEIDYTVIEP